MKKQSFLLLLDKFLEGKCTSKEQEYIINYYESFQDKKDAFDLKKTIL